MHKKRCLRCAIIFTLAFMVIGMATPVSGASASPMTDVGGLAEWYVFAAQMGTAEDAEKDLRQYQETLLEELSGDRTEHFTKNAVTRQKIALAGLVVLDPGQYPEFAAYLETVMADTIGELGLMSWVFGLHLMNNGQVSPNYSQEQVVTQILSMQQENGAWGIMASTPDVDATAMTLCALAEHREAQVVQTAIDKALNYLAEVQGEDGTYQSYGVYNAESCAQVGIALVCLKIDGEDARFEKVWEGLAAFYTDDGYAHTKGDPRNEMATAQGLCAMAVRAAGENPFTVNRWTFSENALKTSYKLPVCAALTIAAVAVVILLYIKKKRSLRHWLPVVLVWLLAVSAVAFVEIQSPSQYKDSITNKESPIGTVTLSISGIDTGTFQIEEGDTVLEVLRAAGVKWNLSMIISNSGYVSEIEGLAEFDQGPLSGWKYKVNGVYPSVGAGDYELAPGDCVEWVYESGTGDVSVFHFS